MNVDNINEHISTHEFDVREDEEQYVKLQDTIDLLLAAGYFRARLKLLPPFDRVVGGMVWCITLCNQSIDVDLFYSENSTIGQKIALTERVVEMLPLLKCPRSIEPHQIQGLDYIHIFPVVQWLVKEAIDAKARRGDMVQNYAIYQFKRYFRPTKTLEQEEAEKDAQLKHYANLKAQCTPLRIYKRIEGFKCPDIFENIQYTLMEYTGQASMGRSSKQLEDKSGKEANEIAERSNKEIMTISSAAIAPINVDKQQRISSGLLANIIDVKSIHDASTNVVSMIIQEEGGHKDANRTRSMLKQAEEQLLKLRIEEKRLEGELTDAGSFQTNLQQQIVELQNRIRINVDLEQSSEDKELIERISQLIAEHDELRKREAAFKANCKAEMLRMQQQLDTLNESIQKHSSQSVKENGFADVDNARRKCLEARGELEKVRLQAAALNKLIALEQRRLDSVPSQIEISQYQRRIIELYNQMAAKHRETKQFYTMHNTLLDVKAHMQREIDLLNSIDDVQQLTSKENYKESFIENLERVLKGVDTTLDKVSTKQKDLQTTRQRLGDDYQYLLDKERLYYKTVDDFKKECQRNEQLRKELGGEKS